MDKNDLDELSDAIKNDKSSRSPNDFGEKVKSWLSKMITKSGTSAWNVTANVATQLLIKALSQYYGL